MTHRRVTIRLEEKDANMLDDLRTLLGVASDSAVLRKVLGQVHTAYRQAGGMRTLAAIRKADSRQLSLLTDNTSKKKRKQ